jgi:hypothetical protein
MYSTMRKRLIRICKPILNKSPLLVHNKNVVLVGIFVVYFTILAINVSSSLVSYFRNFAMKIANIGEHI